MKKEQPRLKNRKILKLLILIAIFLSGCNKIRVENYYIPYGFNGNVAIVYNDITNSGQNQEIYNYKIPDSGILFTKNSFLEGNYIVNYYQRNSLGGYDTLRVEEPSVELDSSKSRIYFPRVLTFSKGENKPIFVTTFYVGKMKTSDLEKDRFHFERRLEKLLLGKDNDTR